MKHFLQDLFPIFSMDFSTSHLAVLEWSGTFNNVHAGNVLVYRWMESEPMANLADLTFTCCRFLEEYLITGGHDKLVSIFDGANFFAPSITRQSSFPSL